MGSASAAKAVQQGAIAHPLPQVEEFLGLYEQGPPGASRFITTVDELLEVPDEMRPTELAAFGLAPVVGRPAVGANDAR